MNRKEIEQLHNQIITEKQYEEIIEHEEVATIDCVGNSGQYPSAIWYDAQFTDGTAIHVFLK